MRINSKLHILKPIFFIIYISINEKLIIKIYFPFIRFISFYFCFYFFFSLILLLLTFTNIKSISERHVVAIILFACVHIIMQFYS